MKNGFSTTQSSHQTHQFACTLGSSPQSARRARHLATGQLEDWGWGRDSQLSQTAALIVAELAANAVTHGTENNTDSTFRLRLVHVLKSDSNAVLRIEVTDSRTDHSVQPGVPSPESVSGRGLLLVAALAQSWGCVYEPPDGKTVWAELNTFVTS